ncbi:hypothetical protein RQP46_009196 [Phenoliferia psychrophenolica]
MMLRTLAPRLGSTTQLSVVRSFSTSPVACSKASRARALKPKAPAPPRLSKTEALRGTGIGASTDVYSQHNSLVLGRDTELTPAAANSDKSTERDTAANAVGGGGGGGLGEVEDASYSAHQAKGEPMRAATVAASKADTASSAPQKTEPSASSSTSSSSSSDGNGKPANDGFGPDTTFYSSTPPYNVPLVLTFSVVVTMFCVIGADTARTGWTKYDEVITKMTIRRPLSTPSPSRFPPTALVTLHTPVSKLPLYPRRTVPLSSINLLGPLSTSPKPWHPKSYIPPAKPPRTGLLADTWRKISKAIIAPPNPRKAGSKPPVTGTHVPILIEGDRFTYSIQKTRGPTGTKDDKTGAWCEDWEGLEKALLGAEGR